MSLPDSRVDVRDWWRERLGRAYCLRWGHWWPKGPGPCATCGAPQEARRVRS